LALLVKGPPIIIFTGLFGAILLFFHTKGKNVLFLKPWFFFPLSLIPLFIWGYFVYLTGGKELINWLLDYYILQRIGGSVLGQTGPPGYYLLSFILFFIPFIMFIPGAVFNSFASIFKKKNSNLFIVGAWFIAGWLIYELLPSKLPSYTAAAHVPLGLLIAIEYKKIVLHLKRFRYFNIGFIVHLILNIVLCAGLFIAPSLLHINYSIGFYVTGTLYFTGLLFIIYLRYNVQYQRMMYLMIVNGAVLLLCLWGLVIPSLNNLTGSTKRVAEYLEHHVKPGTTIVISNKHGKPPSLPFYLKQRFSAIEESYTFPVLFNKYHSNRPYALILNKERADKLKDTTEHVDITKISSLSTDRLDSKNYYIVLNKQAKLKK
jgi:4-amino-4-deoxy-L-arabinose transferase-like glycosyltransferase